MRHHKSPLVRLLFITVAVCAPLPAQTNSDPVVPRVKIVPAPVPDLESAGKSVKQLRAPGLFPPGIPIATDKTSPASPHSIQVLSSSEMTQQDRNLEANAESSIQELAGVENLEFNEGAWTYRQLVCAALPNHLILRFSRNDGTREMSMFSAAIPRGSEGRIHIIPIVRKGYSLFSPAPIGALTIAAFNRIRAEENNDGPADWLGTGLCYAALAGANPQAGQLRAGKPEITDMATTLEPTLIIASNGGATIRFADVSATPRPMEWNMFFDPKGKLVKATHFPLDVGRYQPRAVRTLTAHDIHPADTQP
jgi:hypothetical protein